MAERRRKVNNGSVSILYVCVTNVSVVDNRLGWDSSPGMDENEVYRRLGSLAAARRRGQGLTQEAVGERVGLSRASIANIEAGKQRILLHTIYALLDALSLHRLEDLLPQPSPATGLEQMVPIIGGDADALSVLERNDIERIYRDFAAGGV